MCKLQIRYKNLAYYYDKTDFSYLLAIPITWTFRIKCLTTVLFYQEAKAQTRELDRLHSSSGNKHPKVNINFLQ